MNLVEHVSVKRDLFLLVEQWFQTEPEKAARYLAIAPAPSDPTDIADGDPPDEGDGPAFEPIPEPEVAAFLRAVVATGTARLTAEFPGLAEELDLDGLRVLLVDAAGRALVP